VVNIYLFTLNKLLPESHNNQTVPSKPQFDCKSGQEFWGCPKRWFWFMDVL